MGAEYQSVTYTTTDKAEVQSQWTKAVEQSLYDYGHAYSGCIGMLGSVIDWQGRSFAEPGDCDKFIEDNHRKWDPPMAVAFNGGWVVGGWCSS